jgi:hypothetical protein
MVTAFIIYHIWKTLKPLLLTLKKKNTTSTEDRNSMGNRFLIRLKRLFLDAKKCIRDEQANKIMSDLQAFALSLSF